MFETTNQFTIESPVVHSLVLQPPNDEKASAPAPLRKQPRPGASRPLNCARPEVVSWIWENRGGLNIQRCIYIYIYIYIHDNMQVLCVDED